MKAYVLIREQPWYRRTAFMDGLRAAGHEVLTQQPQRLDKNTLIVIWNRYAGNHDLATQVERAGGKVLVAENGYLGAGGTSPKFDVHPHGPQPHHRYALALGFHNDETVVKVGAEVRFPVLGVTIKPWRTAGEHILVCPNRAFGVPGRSMPPDWAERTAQRIRKQTCRPVKVRGHPGNNAPQRPLAEDLKGAWAVFVWTSSAGVHALVEGIPVFADGPFWIMKSAACTKKLANLEQLNVESPDLPDRQTPMELMSWAQFSIAEIQSGMPFRHLLG